MTAENNGILSYTQNRELSWLKFNERVLEEAMDETVPLLEKLKFIAIFNSNLDEFFMVRVGKLYDLHYTFPDVIDRKSGWNALEQIKNIYREVEYLYVKKDLFFKEVNHRLSQNEVLHLQWRDLNEKQKKMVKQYFTKNIEPILSPTIINSHHPFPHLENKKVYIVATVEVKSKMEFVVIPIPASLPNILELPSEDGFVSFMLIEDIIYYFLDHILGDFEIKEKLKLKVTRNTDIKFEDSENEYEEDLRVKIKQKLKKRKRLAPVRLEVSTPISDELRTYLIDKLELFEWAIYVTSSDMNLEYAFELSSKLTNVQKNILEYAAYEPYIPSNINMEKNMLDQVRKKDILLCYPFESMSPYLKLIKEAAFDKAVISIKITIYRLSSSSKLVEYLCVAAENGKEVNIIIELRARFDEQNNIDWSQKLEEAGCNITYGFENFKVHSKLCLITRIEKNSVRYYTQIGTGNYNEKTAEQYTDLSLMTYNQEIGNDANEFFKNMGIGNLNGSYSNLLVAPYSFKTKIVELVNLEAEKGEEGYIFIKMNSLTDIDLMVALRAASCKGVRIDMVIRGISCLIPKVDSETENINIYSIVGRFLEHSRIYKFGKNEDEKIYIGSADFMTRNMERRVEVATPVLDINTKKKIDKLIEISLMDNMKLRDMTEKSEYIKKGYNRNPINSQENMVNRYLDDELVEEPKHNLLKSFLERFFTSR